LEMPLSEAGLSIVVPCFNEEASINILYDEIKKMFAQNEAKLSAHIKREYEIIFIDDGSWDNTLDILRKIAAEDKRCRFISFSRNFGKEAALLAGFQAANGEYIVSMDADGQDPPSLIPDMLESVVSGGYDCAGCRRVNRSGEPLIRSFFARRFYKLMKKMTDVEIVDGARDFRLINRKYLKALLALPERNRFSKGIFPWVGFKTKWFEYKNIERSKGKTKWSFWKLFIYSLDGIIAFSSKPLAIASFLGVMLFIISIAFIIFIIVRRLVWGDPVSGWASTICIILFCSGVQLFTAGILGQYLAKIYTETKQRPHYIIKEES